MIFYFYVNKLGFPGAEYRCRAPGLHESSGQRLSRSDAAVAQQTRDRDDAGSGADSSLGGAHLEVRSPPLYAGAGGDGSQTTQATGTPAAEYQRAYCSVHEATGTAF